MTTMQIHVEDELKARLAARAAENGYDSVESYVAAVLRAEAEVEFVDDEELEQVLLRRMDDPRSIELTEEFKQQFRQELADRRRRTNGTS
jgi:hypothetical protein